MALKPDIDVAGTLECEPELLPFLPELLQDFESLGSDPVGVVDLLAEHVTGDLASALDLCCGKGATAIAVARELGIHVHGIDAMEAFIEAARTAAARAGVADRCRFTVGELSHLTVAPASFDLVLFGAVGPILGGITATVRHLLGPLRRGGWLLIEDSVLRSGAPPRAGWQNHAGFEETREQIRAAGVEVVTMRRPEIDFEGSHARDHPLLERRAAALLRRRPDLEPLVLRYLQGQWDEVRFLQRWTEDVTWLLRRPRA